MLATATLVSCGGTTTSKTDVATGKPLPSAGFIIKDKDGNEIANE